MSSGPKLLLRAVSGSVVQLPLESVLLSVTVSVQRAIRTISEEIRGPAETALPLTGTEKAGPVSLDPRRRAGPALGRDSPTLSTGKRESILMAWERAGSSPSPETG